MSYLSSMASKEYLLSIPQEAEKIIDEGRRKYQLDKHWDMDFQTKLQLATKNLKKRFTTIFSEYYNENCSDRTSSLSENEYLVEKPELETQNLDLNRLRTETQKDPSTELSNINDCPYKSGEKRKMSQNANNNTFKKQRVEKFKETNDEKDKKEQTGTKKCIEEINPLTHNIEDFNNEVEKEVDIPKKTATWIDEPMPKCKDFFNQTLYDLQMESTYYWIESPLNDKYKEICKSVEFSRQNQEFLLFIITRFLNLSSSASNIDNRILAFNVMVNFYEFFSESFILKYYEYFVKSVIYFDHFFIITPPNDPIELYAAKVLYDTISKLKSQEINSISFKLFSLSSFTCVKLSYKLSNKSINEDEYLHVIANFVNYLFSLKKNGSFWLKKPNTCVTGAKLLMITTENILKAVVSSNQWGAPNNVRNILFYIIYEHIGPDSYVDLYFKNNATVGTKHYMGKFILKNHKQVLMLILDDLKFRDKTYKNISQIQYRLCDVIQSYYSKPDIIESKLNC